MLLNYRKKANRYMRASLFVSMLIGCLVFVLIICGRYLKLSSYVNISGLSDLIDNIFYNNNCSYSEMNKDIYMYIFKVRIIQVFVYIIMCCFFSHLQTSVLFYSAIGAGYGFIYCSMLFQYGLYGFMRIIFFLIPYLFLYLICIKMYDEWIVTYLINVYDTYYRNVNFYKYIKLFIIILCFFIAVFLEIKLQKKLIFFTNM